MASEIDIAVERRLMLRDIERGRKSEAELLNKADELRKKARMIRSSTEDIVKKLAAFDRGL